MHLIFFDFFPILYDSRVDEGIICMYINVIELTSDQLSKTEGGNGDR